MTTCPACGHEALDSARSCVVCATPLPGWDDLTRPPSTSQPVQTGGDTVAETVAGPSRPPTAGTLSSLVAGQTFGLRYRVIRLLGAGGMGEVYHVWDSELNLPLALKVIRPDPNPGAIQELERRFKRELVLARQ